jgi:uncharacterized delta-60 repeat protein
MKNTNFFIVVIFILCFSFFLQGLNITRQEQDKKDNKNVLYTLSTSSSHEFDWYRIWGGSDEDEGFGVAIDSSNNVYVAGFTESFGAGDYDMLLAKYDRNGALQWNHTWGGGSADNGRGVAIDSSDNIYLTGDTRSFGAGAADVILVKYNRNGVQQWNRTWGGALSDYGTGVVIDSLDNVYVTGYSYSFEIATGMMILVKYDGDGVQQWNRTWDGDLDDQGVDVAIDTSNNIYLAGNSRNYLLGNITLIKYDDSGIQQWNRTWGGNYDESCFQIATDSSNNVYLAGTTTSFGAGDSDMVLIKYDEGGVQQWNRTWGGLVSDGGYGVAVDSLNKIYVSGYTRSFGFWDIILVKYDEGGLQQWNCTWGGDFSDFSRRVTVDSSNNVYIVGETSSFGTGDADMFLVKYAINTIGPAISGYSYILIVFSISLVIVLKRVYSRRKLTN